MTNRILHSQYFTPTVHVAACKLYRKHVGHIHDNAAGHNHDNAAGHNHGNSTCNVAGITTAQYVYVMCITSFMLLLFMVLLFESIMSVI